MSKDAECDFIVGKRGMGKSTLLRGLVTKHPRVIVVTPAKADFVRGYLQAHNESQIVVHVRNHWKRGFRIAYKPQFEVDDEIGPIKALHRLVVYCKRLMQPYDDGQHNDKILIAVDEVTRFFPHHRPKGMNGFKWAILEGRHFGMNLLCATQRPTLIPPDFRDNVSRWFVLGCSGDAAKRAAELVGDTGEADQIRGQGKYRYRLYEDGDFRGDYTTRQVPSGYKA